MKPGQRQYTGPLQFFHNYEHDPEGRTHCLGPKSNPYVIVHYDGRHVINVKYAKGHDKKRQGVWFYFPGRIGPGWDLATGEEIDKEEVPDKIPIVNNEIFIEQKLMQMRKKRKLGH